ncbi:MAG: cysteine desulfurase [Saprospiraceae bacterium]|nr:cysteine desulfurase [Saprospiraceae bacterium]
MTLDQRIYLDHAATTPLSSGALEEMIRIGKDFYANPSSIHYDGSKSRSYIEESRKQIAQLLGISSGQLYFTSGGTEAINTVVRSCVMDQKVEHIYSSPIDHPSVLNSIRYYTNYFKIPHTIIATDRFGRINEEDYVSKLKNISDKSLVCLIHTHNETGAINPIEKLALMAKESGALVLADTVQSIGTVKLNLDQLHVDFATGSGHKFNGPKGVGFLYARHPEKLKPFIFGGGQERNLRASTENIMGIAGMKIALEEATRDYDIRHEKVMQLHKVLRTGLASLSDKLEFNSPAEDFHPKILSTYFDLGIHSEYLLMNLDLAGVSSSGGAACSSGSEKASHVLSYLRPGQMGKNIRFSLSHLNTAEEMNQLLSIVKETMDKSK